MYSSDYSVMRNPAVSPDEALYQHIVPKTEAFLNHKRGCI